MAHELGSNIKVSLSNSGFGLLKHALLVVFQFQFLCAKITWSPNFSKQSCLKKCRRKYALVVPSTQRVLEGIHAEVSSNGGAIRKSPGHDRGGQQQEGRQQKAVGQREEHCTLHDDRKCL